MRTLQWILTAVWAVVVANAGAATPGERVAEAVLKACTEVRAQRAPREAAAQTAADRFLQGGTLWVAGSIPRFDIEWLGRAGGLMPVSVMKAPGDVGATDVLVYGCLAGSAASDAVLLRQTQERGGLVVAFGPAQSAEALRPLVSHYLAVNLPADTPMRPQAEAAATLAVLWAFTGDLVGACTRQGKMPTLWQSVMVPGARDRNARYKGQRVHADVTVPPQAAGVLGERYLDGICAALTGLQSQQSTIAQAGTRLRTAVAAKHTVFHANLGHFEPARLLPPAFPVGLSLLPGKDPDADLRRRGAAGDALLAVWYTDMPRALLQAARERGLTSACILASNPGDAARDPTLADHLLDPQWVIGDALVEVPGYDVRILPPSGVLNATVFYAVLAEALAQ